MPDECVIEVDRRLLPGESPVAVLAGYRVLLDELQTQYAGLRAEMEPPLLVDEALETPESADVAQVAQRVLASHGRDARPDGVAFGSDASKLSRQGVPSIVFGPGSIDQAHAAEEFVDLDEVDAAVAFYREFITQFP